MNRQLETAIRHGTPEFRRANLAMFAAGVATFGLLYCVQPLMPEFSRQFGVSAAQSALSLSFPSAVIAVTLLFAGPISDAWGRKRLMTIALFASALLALLTVLAPNWQSFLLLRALLGLALGGLPAAGMAYLSEELHPESLGLGIGLYIGGNAVGGLLGRLIAGVATDFFGWRIGLGAVAVIGLLGALLFARYLPLSRGFVRHPLQLRSVLGRFATLFRDPGLPWLFAVGGVLLGGFVTIYNYISYRLIAPPYSLRGSVVGLIFSVYIVGVFSSSWVGHLAGRIGRRKVLWSMFALQLAGLGLTMLTSVGLVVVGIAVITFGFFRWSLDRQQLGGPSRRRREGAGSGDLLLLFLCRLQRDRGRRRVVLRCRRVERRRSLRCRSVGTRSLIRVAAVLPGAAARTAIAGNRNSTAVSQSGCPATKAIARASRRRWRAGRSRP